MKQAILNLIDRKIKENQDTWYPDEARESVLEELRDNIEKMDEWIPVSERLPEKDNRILMCEGVWVELWRYNEDKRIWINQLWTEYFPTHWQYLPLPYNP